MSVFLEQSKTRNLEINVADFEEHIWSRVLVQIASNTCPNLSQNQVLSQMFDAIYSELLTVSLSKPQIKKKMHCQQSRLHHSAAAVESHSVNLNDACDR
jgi:DNA uptake protein ComE-like DNA-binding protein